MKNRELHRITSTAIIVKNGRYLIIRRSLNKKSFPGKWTVPGGGLETDDYTTTPKTTQDHWYFAIEKSLRREIREEVNLEVKELDYLLDLAFILPDETPTIVLSFWSHYKSGKVRIDEDSIDYKWATLKELKNYDLVEGLYEEIEMVDRMLKKGSRKTVSYRKRQKIQVSRP